MCVEVLYDNNLLAIFIVAGFTVYKLESLREYQRMMLYYALMFAVSVFATIRIIYLLPVSFVALFIFMEYFSNDTVKADILLKFKYKVLDYLYYLFFIYHYYGILISFLLLYFSHVAENDVYRTIFIIAAVIVFCITVHVVSRRDFEVSTFSEMAEKISKMTFYQIRYSKALAKRFDILTFIEDRSYFERSTTYNFVSLEFLKYKISQIKRLLGGKSIRYKLSECKAFAKKSITLRGYSTLEMQLIRNLSVKHGYDTCVIRRKFYELIYSIAFFSSLRNHYKRSTKLGLVNFKNFLLYVYCFNVDAKVGQKRQRFDKFFADKKIEDWPLEQMLVVCVGLSHRKITEETIEKYRYLIDKYNLDESKIFAYYNQYAGVVSDKV